MKTYIITEKDIENLIEWFKGDYYSEGIIENWKENLNELPLPKKLDWNFEVPDDFYTNRVKYFVNLELDTEFGRFVEDNFIRPTQPYYVKDGEIFDYGDVREIFLENRREK